MAAILKFASNKDSRRLACLALNSFWIQERFERSFWQQSTGGVLLPTGPSEAVRGHIPAYELRQLRWSSRPRGPLWRGRKLVCKEAVLTVQELRRHKLDGRKIDELMRTKVARLLKMELLQVLSELQRQDEVDLAFKIFNAVRNEVWYKPDEYLYKDMLNILGRNKRVEECQVLFEDLKREGLKPNSLLCTELMSAYMEVGMVPEAMEVYQEIKQSGAPLEVSTFRVLMRGLKKLGKKELRKKVQREYRDYFEGLMGENEESDETAEGN
eukprot:c26320_g2_i1 orf=597-1403(+)